MPCPNMHRQRTLGLTVPNCNPLAHWLTFPTQSTFPLEAISETVSSINQESISYMNYHSTVEDIPGGDATFP